MRNGKKRLVLVSACLTLVVGLGACSSSGSTSKSSDSTSVTTAKAGDTSDTTAAGAKNSNAPDVGDPANVKLTDPTASGPVVTWTKDKKWDPAEITISKSQILTFKAEQGASTTGVSFDGGKNSATITGGLVEAFSFAAPGTYTASDAITSVTMKVIVTD